MLEVCVDTLAAAVAAQSAGAGRLELCTALDVGGVTPCSDLIHAVRSQVSCELVVLIRPRTGDFLYSAEEIRLSIASIRTALAAGADGVVVGALTGNSHGQSLTHGLDVEALQAMREAAGSAQLVLHRAFDFVQDPFAAIDQLVALGFRRVLTSGGTSGCITDHIQRLRELVQYAGPRLTIMPGGGVRADNAGAILTATGCRELHGSFRIPQPTAALSSLGTNPTLDTQAIAHVKRLFS